MGELKPVISTEELNGGFRWVSATFDEYETDRKLVDAYYDLEDKEGVFLDAGMQKEADDVFEACGAICRKLVERYILRQALPKHIEGVLNNPVVSENFEELFKLAWRDVTGEDYKP